MPTLLVEDISNDLYERLQRRAAARRRPLGEEVALLLESALQKEEPAPRLPDYVPSEEIPAPFDLPRSNPAERVEAHDAGLPRLPDPLPDEVTQG